MNEINLKAIVGIPLITKGDDIGAIVFDTLHKNNIELNDSDILVIASKIISKAEGKIIDLTSVTPSDKAQSLATQSEKDPRIIELMLQDSKAVIRVKQGLVVTLHRLGFVCTSAGIDRSNVKPGTVCLLPQNPDASARKIREYLEKRSGKKIGVIINDSGGIEYRRGSIGLAVGFSGLSGLFHGNQNEQQDLYEHPQNINISLADELSAAASLLMGQSNASLPVVLVRGYKFLPDEKSGLNNLLEQYEERKVI